MRVLSRLEMCRRTLLSAYVQDHNIEHTLEMGFSNYVVKPFSSTELVARIKADPGGRSYWLIPSRQTRGRDAEFHSSR